MTEEQPYTPTIVDNRLHTIQEMLQGVNERHASITRRIQASPISIGESKVPIGLQYVYQTQALPSTRLVIIFDESDREIIAIPKNVLYSYEPLDMDATKRSLNLFINHPDKRVIEQLIGLVETLQREGFDFRAMPMRDVMAITNPDIDVDISGMQLFPLLYLKSRYTDEVVYVNTEAVVIRSAGAEDTSH